MFYFSLFIPWIDFTFTVCRRVRKGDNVLCLYVCVYFSGVLAKVLMKDQKVITECTWRADDQCQCHSRWLPQLIKTKTAMIQQIQIQIDMSTNTQFGVLVPESRSQHILWALSRLGALRETWNHKIIKIKCGDFCLIYILYFIYYCTKIKDKDKNQKNIIVFINNKSSC